MQFPRLGEDGPQGRRAKDFVLESPVSREFTLGPDKQMDVLEFGTTVDYEAEDDFAEKAARAGQQYFVIAKGLADVDHRGQEPWQPVMSRNLLKNVVTVSF